MLRCASREAALGTPIDEGVTRRGQAELEYSDAAYRFDDGCLVEVTVDAPVIFLDQVAVPFEMLTAFVRRNDREVFDAIDLLLAPVTASHSIPIIRRGSQHFQLRALQYGSHFQIAEAQQALSTDVGAPRVGG